MIIKFDILNPPWFETANPSSDSIVVFTNVIDDTTTSHNSTPSSVASSWY